MRCCTYVFHDGGGALGIAECGACLALPANIADYIVCKRTCEHTIDNIVPLPRTSVLTSAVSSPQCISPLSASLVFRWQGAPHRATPRPPRGAAHRRNCHFHGNAPVAEKVFVECATERKTTLMNGGTLTFRSNTVQHEKIEQIDSKNGKQWQISFKNLAVTEQGKATCFVFMRLPINYVVAKFTAQ